MHICEWTNTDFSLHSLYSKQLLFNGNPESSIVGEEKHPVVRKINIQRCFSKVFFSPNFQRFTTKPIGRRIPSSVQNVQNQSWNLKWWPPKYVPPNIGYSRNILDSSLIRSRFNLTSSRLIWDPWILACSVNSLTLNGVLYLNTTSEMLTLPIKFDQQIKYQWFELLCSKITKNKLQILIPVNQS